MSKVVQLGLEKVQDTKFIFNDRGGFEIRNAYIFWTNFRGEANQFGNSTRNFNLGIPKEVGFILRDNGWRVRERSMTPDVGKQLYPDGTIKEDTLYFINIKVNMNSITPPILSLYSEFKGKRTKRALDIESIGELDRIDILDCDLEVNAYESPAFPGKITGYLKKLNAIMNPDIEFGGKYDDWLDEEYDCLADGSCSLDNE